MLKTGVFKAGVLMLNLLPSEFVCPDSAHNCKMIIRYHVFRVGGMTIRVLLASLLLVNKSNLHRNEILVTHASRGLNIYRI